MGETADLTGQLLARARSGDGGAFAELAGPLRRELQVHCYRILGSAADAEDMLQETMMAAWQALDRFEGRASLRTWLHAIATNKCLNHLRAARSLPPYTPAVPLPEPTRSGEPLWLEPYPDALLGDLPDAAAGPEARYEARESVSLAFVTALQYLPPRQRATLVLRDDAFERADVQAIVALLTDDAWLTMPPLPFEYQGHDAVAHFLAAVSFRHGTRQSRLIPVRANGQPAFGRYLRDPHTPVGHAHGLIVLTLAGDRICAITGFTDNSVLPKFGLPRTLPE